MRYWTKLEVYNDDLYLGYFYTDETNRVNWYKEIDQKYGKGNWTKFNIGN